MAKKNKLKKVGYGSVENMYGVRITKSEQNTIKRMQRKFKKENEKVRGAIASDLTSYGFDLDEDLLSTLPNSKSSGSLNRFTSQKQLKETLKKLRKTENIMKKGKFLESKRDLFYDNSMKSLDGLLNLGREGKILADNIAQLNKQEIEMLLYVNHSQRLNIREHYLQAKSSDYDKQQKYIRAINANIKKIIKGRS